MRRRMSISAIRVFTARWRCRRGSNCGRGRSGACEGRPRRNPARDPTVPYLDTLRWALIAISLIAISLIDIAVTIHARLDEWRRGQR